MTNTLSAKTYPQQKRQMFVYSVGSGFVIGGVGALINKKPHQNGWKVFLKGAGQGTLGGLINYGAKNITSQIAKQENYAYGWAARITQSAGTSIIYNAASNRNFWEAYYFNYGAVRLAFDMERQYKPSMKVLPASLVGMVWMGTQGKLSMKYSLLSGAPVLLSDGSFNIFGASYAGYVMGNSTILDRTYVEDFRDYELFAHEFIHILQYDDFISVNTYFNPLINKLKDQSVFVNSITKYVYPDLHAPMMMGTYHLMTKDGNYFHNWWEFEAEHFATQRFVER
jgi:hypothetical protein